MRAATIHTPDGKSYREYMESDEWDRLRKGKIVTSGRICQKCRSPIKPGLAHVHHRNYRNFGHETEGDTCVEHVECHLKGEHHRRSKCHT